MWSSCYQNKKGGYFYSFAISRFGWLVSLDLYSLRTRVPGLFTFRTLASWTRPPEWGAIDRPTGRSIAYLKEENKTTCETWSWRSYWPDNEETRDDGDLSCRNVRRASGDWKRTCDEARRDHDASRNWPNRSRSVIAPIFDRFPQLSRTLNFS